MTVRELASVSVALDGGVQLLWYNLGVLYIHPDDPDAPWTVCLSGCDVPSIDELARLLLREEVVQLRVVGTDGTQAVGLAKVLQIREFDHAEFAGVGALEDH